MSWHQRELEFERVEQADSTPSALVLGIFWMAQSVVFWRGTPRILCVIGDWVRVCAILGMSWLFGGWLAFVSVAICGTFLRWLKEQFSEPKKILKSRIFWSLYDWYWHIFGVLVAVSIVLVGLWAMQWSGWWLVVAFVVALVVAVEPGWWLLRAWVARVVRRGRVPRPEMAETICKAMIVVADEEALRRLKEAGF